VYNKVVFLSGKFNSFALIEPFFDYKNIVDYIYLANLFIYVKEYNAPEEDSENGIYSYTFIEG
jgi:hypothetical protein